MTGHLSPNVLSALTDGELSADQLLAAYQHLAECRSCTSNALVQSLLKSATAKAGRRYEPPPDLRKRLATQLWREEPREASHLDGKPLNRWRPTWNGWAAAAAVLLVCINILWVQNSGRRSAILSSEQSTLATEVCDQHIAALAANAPLQVISSDRHTVKPWFQGRLPFSFNLPETLPSGTTLDGANLTYIHNQPTAQLLFSIGKHRVSVFLDQRTGTQISHNFSTDHAGFHVVGFQSDEINGIAVSDVDPARLSDLASLLARTQKMNR
jgi:anti-sigma factor RsiW